MADLSEPQVGLIPKYDIVDREKGTPLAKPAFVLVPESDPFARVAIRTYARHCAYTHPQLALELNEWIDEVEKDQLKEVINRLKVAELQDRLANYDFDEDEMIEGYDSMGAPIAAQPTEAFRDPLTTPGGEVSSRGDNTSSTS